MSSSSPLALRAESTPADLSYGALLAELREPFVIFGRDERLIVWNRAYAEMHRDENGHCILHEGLSVDDLAV